jgi:hypothetical protein
LDGWGGTGRESNGGWVFKGSAVEREDGEREKKVLRDEDGGEAEADSGWKRDDRLGFFL